MKLTPTKSVKPSPPLNAGVDPAPAPTDADLVAAVLRGDVQVAGALYDRLRPVVHRTIRRVLHGRPDDLDDLVQTTFERIIRSLAQRRFDGRSQLTTWSAAIAAHVAMDTLRRRYRERGWLSTNIPAVGDSLPESRLEARSEIRRLHAILARMKPNLADTLILHDILEHEVAEIAEMTGSGVSATQSRLLRARRELLRRSQAKVPGKGANRDA